jgi:tetratricopeptide (TPR) repeat protein
MPFAQPDSLRVIKLEGAGMKRTIAAGMLLAGLVAAHQVTAWANGSPVPRTPSASRSMTPEERAVEAYNSGIERRDKGKRFEQEAAVKQGPERQKAEAKARGEFEKALKDFRSAAQLNPSLFQAYNGIGYSLRKIGDYENALLMYDKAIEMAPGLYTEAIEYRAEAYLGLNRIEDAKKSYLDLFGSDRRQADLLLQEMKNWVAKRQADPAGVDPAALAAFDKWIAERAGISLVTAHMATSRAPSTW